MRNQAVDGAEEEMRAQLAAHGLDMSVPNVARIYDFMLGGKDNFAADRDAAVVEQAYFISGARSLGAGYERDGAARWVARRHPGGRISWRMHPADPGLAA